VLAERSVIILMTIESHANELTRANMRDSLFNTYKRSASTALSYFIGPFSGALLNLFPYSQALAIKR